MQMSRIRGALASAAVIVLIAVACNESTAPTFELAVTNNPDDFLAQSVTVLNASLDREYTWQNSGTRATITHGTVVDNGAARIGIKDAVGATIYDRALTFGMSEQTQVGAAGAWRIEILLAGFSGTGNVRVQKL